MSIAVKCPACQAGLKVQDEHAGKPVKCPKCGQVMTVPVPVPAAGAEELPTMAPSEPAPRDLELTALLPPYSAATKGLLPPGPYMLFVVDGNLPSEARFVSVP